MVNSSAGNLWKRVDAVVTSHRTFTVTTHVDPDGDAVGSELALHRFLRKRGKNARIINTSKPPEAFHFLEGCPGEFTVYTESDDAWIAASDVIFVLDISKSERLIRMEPSITRSQAYTVCIDHHGGNDFPADLSIIRESACATGELIYDLYTVLGETIDSHTATALYSAIVTDTYSFSHSNTGTRAHVIAADLIERGVDPADIYSRLYASQSWDRVELFKMYLAGLRRECRGRLVWVSVTREMVDASGARLEELEGLVDFPLTIAGVEMSVLFLEVPGKGTKISLRSGNSVDVQDFSQRLGGGGHKHAAGIRLFDVSLDAAVPMILDAARRLF